MNVSTEIEIWGDALARWPRDVVEKMGVSADDALYLTTIGLPVGVDWTLRIAPPSDGAPQVVNSMPIIAFDGPVPICVDKRAGGALVAIQGDARRIVNTSVRRFGTFLMLYQSYRRRVRGLDDPEDAAAHALIDEIEKRMKETDDEVMRVDGSYWREVIEQMRYGFL